MIGQMNSIRIYHPLFLFYFSSPSYPIRFFFAPIEGENERTRYGPGTDRVRRKYEGSTKKVKLFYLSAFLFNHSNLRQSGKCFTLKCSKVTLNPVPSGQAAISPTCTGVLSCNQALRIRVYSLSSNE